MIRFSSIGDIVLTSPAIRSCRKAYPDAKIHYITKKQYKVILAGNPYIDHLHLFDGDLNKTVKELSGFRFDLIIDLHRSLRSRLLCLRLGRQSVGFPKLNLKKWLLVHTKKNLMPGIHIAERYMSRLKSRNILPDGLGLDYFVSDKDRVIDHPGLQKIISKDFIAIVAGAKHYTKQIPAEVLIDIIAKVNLPVVILGGPDEREKAESIAQEFAGETVFNACGLLSLGQSAEVIRRSALVLTSDTGLMHIAAAFQKKIVSIWGNTVPELGMYPYMPQHPERSVIFEIKNLPCRPCSKIGFDSCPKKHFKCMLEQDTEKIAATIKGLL
jgi:heptosyltransferase-2